MLREKYNKDSDIISIILMLCNSIIMRPTGTYSNDTVVMAETIKRIIEERNNE